MTVDAVSVVHGNERKAVDIALDTDTTLGNRNNTPACLCRKRYHRAVAHFLIINAVGFLLMLADKRKAQKKLWRIPEATLLGIAVLGGSVGSLAGMYLVHHKTRHIKFTLGIPVILIIQSALLYFLLK